jgi:hypothetical protein
MHNTTRHAAKNRPRLCGNDAALCFMNVDIEFILLLLMLNYEQNTSRNLKLGTQTWISGLRATRRCKSAKLKLSFPTPAPAFTPSGRN